MLSVAGNIYKEDYKKLDSEKKCENSENYIRLYKKIFNKIIKIK